MKATLLAGSALLVSQVALAISGGPVVHDLACRSVKGRLGVDYSLKITTQALAPEYFVRGCSVIKKVVAPRAEPLSIPLAKVSQDAETAVFMSENFTVKLDKKSFTAELLMGDEVEYICSQK